MRIQLASTHMHATALTQSHHVQSTFFANGLHLVEKSSFMDALDLIEYTL